MILNILRIAITIVEVILIFNLLIIVHELGHYLAARWRGLQIDKFGIWFGKPLWKKTINGVEFSLGCIPAGGFVEMTSGGAFSVRIAAPKSEPSPAATQFARLEHDTASSERVAVGAFCGVQLWPPSLVVKILDPPTAVHFATSTQVMDVSPTLADPRSFHCEPPSVVAIT